MTGKDNRADKGAVCIIRHSNYPAELNVRREAEALLQDGYQVHVICLRERGQAPRETIDGVQVRRLPVSHRRGKIRRYLLEYNAFFLLASLEVIKLWCRTRLRAIQVNSMPDYLVFAAVVPRLFGTKTVLHLHEPMPELFSTMFDERRRWWLIWLIKLSERLSIRFADRVLTVTQEMKANFCRRGADPRKITVIVNVPDDRYFRLEHYSEFVAKVSRTRDAELKPGTVRILSHGSIEDRYGYDLIVHAVAALKAELPNLQFRFMGQGGSLHDVLKLACSLGIADQVCYLGFVPFETMVEEIIAADITVVPMKKNPYSILVHTNKMFEYLALQRPIVASRLDSVASYFPDSAIAYFKPDDSSALAQAILQCVRDPEASRARVRAATEVYERYRWSNERAKYLDVYRELLKDQPRGTTVMGAA